MTKEYLEYQVLKGLQNVRWGYEGRPYPSPMKAEDCINGSHHHHNITGPLVLDSIVYGDENHHWVMHQMNIESDAQHGDMDMNRGYIDNTHNEDYWYCQWQKTCPYCGKPL